MLPAYSRYVGTCSRRETRSPSGEGKTRSRRAAEREQGAPCQPPARARCVQDTKQDWRRQEEREQTAWRQASCDRGLEAPCSVSPAPHPCSARLPAPLAGNRTALLPGAERRAEGKREKAHLSPPLCHVLDVTGPQGTRFEVVPHQGTQRHGL